MGSNSDQGQPSIPYGGVARGWTGGNMGGASAAPGVAGLIGNVGGVMNNSDPMAGGPNITDLVRGVNRTQGNPSALGAPNAATFTGQVGNILGGIGNTSVSDLIRTVGGMGGGSLGTRSPWGVKG